LAIRVSSRVYPNGIRWPMNRAIEVSGFVGLSRLYREKEGEHSLVEALDGDGGTL